MRVLVALSQNSPLITIVSKYHNLTILRLMISLRLWRLCTAVCQLAGSTMALFPFFSVSIFDSVGGVHCLICSMRVDIPGYALALLDTRLFKPKIWKHLSSEHWLNHYCGKCSKLSVESSKFYFHENVLWATLHFFCLSQRSFTSWRTTFTSRDPTCGPKQQR